MEAKSYTLDLTFIDRTVILAALEIARKSAGIINCEADYKAMYERLLPVFDEEDDYE